MATKKPGPRIAWTFDDGPARQSLAEYEQQRLEEFARCFCSDDVSDRHIPATSESA